MVNPVLKQLANQSKVGNLQKIQQMANVLKGASDPRAMIDMMARNNPQLQNVLQFVHANGDDPKAAFYKAAQEQGIDPDEVLRLLQ